MAAVSEKKLKFPAIARIQTENKKPLSETGSRVLGLFNEATNTAPPAANYSGSYSRYFNYEQMNRRSLTETFPSEASASASTTIPQQPGFQRRSLLLNSASQNSPQYLPIGSKHQYPTSPELQNRIRTIAQRNNLTPPSPSRWLVQTRSQELEQANHQQG